MVLVHIISSNKKQAKQIVSHLLSEKLIVQAYMAQKKMLEQPIDAKEAISKKRMLIVCKTKALLFDTINNALRERFSENMPLLYAIPIVYMDSAQTNWLRENTAKV